MNLRLSPLSFRKIVIFALVQPVRTLILLSHAWGLRPASDAFFIALCNIIIPCLRQCVLWHQCLSGERCCNILVTSFMYCNLIFYFYIYFCFLHFLLCSGTRFYTSFSTCSLYWLWCMLCQCVFLTCVSLLTIWLGARNSRFQSESASIVIQYNTIQFKGNLIADVSWDARSFFPKKVAQ